MDAELQDVFEYSDPCVGDCLVENFCRLRENGLFLDVTLKVICSVLL